MRKAFICILLSSVFFSTFSLNSKSETSNPFNDYISPSNGVNQYSGDAAFSQPLFTLNGKNGLNISMALSYSSNVYLNVRARNDKGPTGWCGLGWYLGFGSILCDHKGTKTKKDDDYYWISPTGVSGKIYEKDGTFYLKNNPYWKVERIDTYEDDLVDGWILTDEAGTKYKYGNPENMAHSSSTRNTLYWPSSGYVGNGFGGNPEIYPYQWDLDEIQDPYGNKIDFKYEKIEPEVKGTWTGVRIYTQSSYLKEITNSDGAKIVFSRKSKDPKEYYDAQNSSEEPDGFMEMYETEYLDNIAVYNNISADKPAGNLIKQIQFCYKLFNKDSEGNFAKRLLTDVTEYTMNGEKVGKTRFTYYDDEKVTEENDRNYHSGALDSIILPTCGKIKYVYKRRNYHISTAPTPLSKGELGDNPTLKTGTVDDDEYILALDKDKKLWMYQWNGSGWEKKFKPTDINLNNINNICAGHNFFVISYNGGSNARIMEWNGKNWVKRDFDYDGKGSSWNPVMKNFEAGNNFFVAYNSDGMLYAERYEITKSAIIRKLILTQSSYTGVNIQISFNTIAFQGKLGGKWYYYIYKKLGEDNWDCTYLAHPFPHEETEDAFLSLGMDGDYFVIRYEPGRKDWVYFYNWNGTEWVQTKGREKIGGSGRAIVYPGNDYFVIRHKSSEHITVFNWDGNQWKKTISNEKVTGTSHINIYPSRDFYVITYANCYVERYVILPVPVYIDDVLTRVYYKNGDKWKKCLLGEFPSGKKIPKIIVTGNNFFAAIGQSGSQTFLSWAYSWDSNTGWNNTFYNSNVIGDLIGDSYSAGAYKGFGGIGNFFYYSFAKEDSKGRYKGATKFSLFRKYQDYFNSLPWSFTVTEKHVNDPVENREFVTTYNYPKYINVDNFDTQNGIAKFSSVETVLPGKNGKIVKYFYNDIYAKNYSPDYIAHPEYYDFDGMVYKEEIYREKQPSETDPKLLSSTDYEYQKHTDKSWPENVFQNRLTKTTNTNSGISTINQTNSFDNNNGLPVETSAQNTNGTITNKIKYAYEIYPDMDKDHAHMLSQQCQSKTFEGNSSSNSNIRMSSVTTWSDMKGTNSLAPYSTYVWNVDRNTDGTLKKSYTDFNFSNPDANSANWNYKGAVEKYWSDGVPVEQEDPLNRPSVHITGYNHSLQTAEIANAHFDECGVFTGDYDNNDAAHTDYYDYDNGWKRGGTSIVNTSKHFGSNSVSIKNGDEGLSKELNGISKKNYQLSCWVNSEHDGSIKFEVLNGSSDLHSADIEYTVPAGGWHLVKREIKAADIGNLTSLKIRISAGKGSNLFVDDIRFAPVDAFVSTTYYDPLWHTPIASIDANNYAKYVEYDKRGRPIVWRNDSRVITSQKEYYSMLCNANSDDATLKSLTVSEGDLEFDPSTFEYEVVLPNSIDEIQITPVVSNSEASLSIDGVPQVCPCGNQLDFKNLPEGIKEIKLLVTAPNGIKQNTYIVRINRLTNCWNFTGDKAISHGKPSNQEIEFKNDGTPYIAYIDEGDGDKLYVKYLDAGEWKLVGSGPVYDDEVKAFSFKIINNSLWIAYTYTYVSSTDEDDATDRLVVKKFNGAAWQDVSTDPYISDNVGTDICLASNGSLTYLAYQYESGSDDEYPEIDIIVKKLSGSNWINVGSDGIVSDEGAKQLHLALSSTGVPYIGYIHANTNNDDDNQVEQLIIKQFNGAEWIEVQSISDKTILKFDMEVIGNVPYAAICEQEEDNEENENYSFTVKKYESGNWSVIGLEQPIFRINSKGDFDLARVSSDLFIAFSNEDNKSYGTVIKYNPSKQKWISYGNPAFVKMDESEALNLAVSSSDEFMGFSDPRVNKKLDVMQFIDACPSAILEDLSIAEGMELSPQFRNYIVNYKAEVGATTDEITINASPVSGATVKIRGTTANSVPVTLVSGENKIPIVVTASDGKTLTVYTLIVKKPLSAYASLCGFDVTDNNSNKLNYSPTFSADIFKYSLKVPFDIDQINVNPVQSDGAAAYINGTIANGNNVTLGVGNNKVLITVVAPNGKATVEYELDVIREANNKLSFKTLSFSPSVTLTPTFNSTTRDVFSYSGNVVNSVSGIALSASSDGTIRYQGNPTTYIPFTLSTGYNQIPVEIYDPDNDISTFYTFNISRPASDLTSLNGLTLKDNSGKTISLTFSSTIFNYNLSVASNIPYISVFPVAKTSGSTVKVNGKTPQSGVVPVTLNTGMNEIEISIKSASNPEETKYYLHINKAVEIPVSKVGFETKKSPKIYEGDKGVQTFSMYVSISDANFIPVSVDYEVTGGTATSPDDYELANGTLNFDPCEPRKAIDVKIKGDTKIEDDKTLIITLKNALPGGKVVLGQSTYTLTITDDDYPTVNFNSGTSSVNENVTPSYLDIPLSLSETPAKQVKVNIGVNEITAHSGASGDFELSNNVVVFNPGQKTSSLRVNIHDDVQSTGPVTAEFYIKSASNAQITAPKSNVMTIIDDEGPAHVRFVKAGAVSSTGDGKSWDHAYKYLQDALDYASDPANGVTEIRIAEGYYFPDDGNNHEDGKSYEHFYIPDGVTLKGGYPPNGGDEGDRRTTVTDPSRYKTILSGFINGSGDVLIDGNSNNILVGSKFEIDGLTITGGNANTSYIPSPAIPPAGSGSSSSSIVVSCYACGGAITLTGDESDVRIKDCIIDNNHAVQPGGAIHLSIGKIDIQSSNLSNNTCSAPGGAIELGSEGSISISDGTSFINNSSNSIGGAIDGGNGYDIDNCRFDGNHSSQGGAIYNFNSDAAFIIKGTNFKNNYSDNPGGAIYANANIVISDNCKFESNESKYSSGGAICSYSKIITIKKSDFINNKCTGSDGYGGAIYMLGGQLLDINDECHFTSNTADVPNLTIFSGHGGAIYCICDELKINKSYFIGNKANGLVSNGGAIQGGIEKLETMDCFFQNNSGAFGGAIYNDASDNQFLINNTVFDNNNGSAGGAIYCINTSVDRFINCTFNNNFGENGGCIYSIGNQYEYFGNCTFNQVKANLGGVAYFYGDAHTVSFNNCIFWNIDNITDPNCEFYINDPVINIIKNYCYDEIERVIPPFEDQDNPIGADRTLDGLRLNSSSYCVDHGNEVNMDLYPQNTSGDIIDITGRNRVVNSGIDIGAYETQ